MYKVGITGGIGSGKSSVCSLLAAYGVAVYDSDSAAKRLMAENEELRQRLMEVFGAECYTDGVLNRAYLASRVFGNDEQLKLLNSTVHPAVKADFEAWAEQQTSPYVVLESAILFESGFDAVVDTTLAVIAPMEERIRRTMERDGVDREAVLSRISHQMSDDELHSRATRTMVNILRDYLESDVEQLHKRYLYESAR
ncbi:MAG: dephospho-CoA kinase [Alistipes sp.]|nr:dephospho-CoA kinase [Alistipes sp.]